MLFIGRGDCVDREPGAPGDGKVGWVFGGKYGY
jgi:hypothetical protein